ncbi:9067_t:CDS:2, partial [Ambispora leptoticha]
MSRSSSSQSPLVRLEYDEMKNTMPKHIIFLSIFGGRSHVKPKLEIGQMLVDRVAPNSNEIIAREHPKIELITIDPIREGNLFLNEHYNFRHLRAFYQNIENYYSYVFPILLNAAIERQADLLICGMERMAEVCADVAWVLGLPIVLMLEHYELSAAAPYKSDP